MTKVKICGLSDRAAIETAIEADADFIGFVFAPSRRQVTADQASALVEGLTTKVKKIGVFVSPDKEELEEAISKVGLDLIQIHGDYDEKVCLSFSLPVIRAISVKEGRVPTLEKADYYLFDAPVSGAGETFDWSALDITHVDKPVFIAGGLTVDNVKSCINHFQPYAVDVSSGVETDGKKDLAKISAFIGEVKNDISRTR